MNCDRCGAANDDRSRFCTECGAPLAPKLAVGHNPVTDVPPVPMPPAGPIPGPGLSSSLGPASSAPATIAVPQTPVPGHKRRQGRCGR